MLLEFSAIFWTYKGKKISISMSLYDFWYSFEQISPYLFFTNVVL